MHRKKTGYGYGGSFFETYKQKTDKVPSMVSTYLNFF